MALPRDPARLAAAITAAARRSGYPGAEGFGAAASVGLRRGQAGAGQTRAGQAGAGRSGWPDSGEPLAGMVDVLADVVHAAEDGRLDGAATLASLTAARNLAAELERSELALITAARDTGATWSQIAAAMGTRNRQTAQKRHADLNRRFLRPP